MDFFEQQDVARRHTFKLIVLIVLAVICIIAVTYPVVCLGIIIAVGVGSEGESILHPSIFLEPQWILIGIIAVSGMVLLGSLYKMAQLRAGGRVVAEMLGARFIPQNTSDPNERKILNVVEEMAIASGVPVPPVYIMNNETRINAFAAGYSPDDAVIGVTRGSVELLDRDELQGVMAHEFSHILNGDMRLNIRLIGLIHGILVIGLVGWGLIRVAFYSGGVNRRRSKDEGGAVLALGIVGIAFITIGSIGVFFGNIIKAAISRQREYLADAAAVQFTRNPGGISGALQKIGGLNDHGLIHASHASEISHLFFVEGVSHLLGSMMATHPALPKRIGRIDPQWNGVFPSVKAPPHDSPQDLNYQQRIEQMRAEQEARRKKMMQTLAGSAVIVGGMTMSQRIAAAREATGEHAEFHDDGTIPLADTVGQADDHHIAYAQFILDSIPQPLREAAREPFGARAVVYGLLLDREDAKVGQPQRQRIEAFAETGVPDLVGKLESSFSELDVAARLALVELCLGSLRQLSLQQYKTFSVNVTALVKADEQTSLFEWVLQRMLLEHLLPTFDGPKPNVVKYYRLRGVVGPLSVLLSTLVYVGHRDMAEAQKAFAKAQGRLELNDVKLLEPKQCGLGPLGQALDELATVALREKKKLVLAVADAIASDGHVTLKEGELLRAICDALHCPLPPLLPGRKVG